MLKTAIYLVVTKINLTFDQKWSSHIAQSGGVVGETEKE